MIDKYAYRENSYRAAAREVRWWNQREVRGRNQREQRNKRTCAPTKKQRNQPEEWNQWRQEQEEILIGISETFSKEARLNMLMNEID
jgi:hypothetical protein